MYCLRFFGDKESGCSKELTILMSRGETSALWLGGGGGV